MGSISVHKLKHYRSRALLKRLKLKPDRFGMKHEKQSSAVGWHRERELQEKSILIDFPTRIFSDH